MVFKVSLILSVKAQVEQPYSAVGVMTASNSFARSRRAKALLDNSKRRQESTQSHSSVSAVPSTRGATHSSTMLPQRGSGMQHFDGSDMRQMHNGTFQSAGEKEFEKHASRQDLVTVEKAGDYAASDPAKTTTGSVHLDQANVHFKRAEANKEAIDRFTANLEEDEKVLASLPDTNPAVKERMRKRLKLNRLKAAMVGVSERNKEFAALNKHALTSNVDTEKDGAVFWAGHSYHDEYVGSETRVDAMKSAHEYARRNNKLALEQTRGGAQMEEFGGEYSRVAKRFAYLSGSEEGDEAQQQASKQSFRGHRTRLLEQQLGDDHLGSLTSDQRANIGKSSPAGGIWNQLSRRFAAKASGEVTVVHGVNHDEFYGDTGQGSHWGKKTTWLGQERPQLLRSEAVTAIKSISNDRTDLSEVRAGALHNQRTVERNDSGHRDFHKSSARRKDFGPKRPTPNN